MSEKVEEKPKFEKINFKTLTIEILTIILGAFVTAIGYKVFLAPKNIVPGGFMGLAQIIYDFLSQINFTAISVSVWYLILNAFLYIYAVKCLGLKFGIRSGFGIASYSLFVGLIDKIDLFNSIRQQLDLEATALNGGVSYVLYAIYGGVLMGAGIGLIFRGNGSAGGSDVVAVVVNKFFPTITTGQIVIAVDAIVVVLSAIAYQSIVLPLFALIAIFICGKVSDIFVDGVKSFRAYYIITEKKEELSQMIFDKVHRGVTNIKCEGMYTHQDRNMLLVIVRRSQVMPLKKVVKMVDPESFMFSASVKEAYGKGFLTYTENKHKKNKINVQNKNTNIKNENITKENKPLQTKKTRVIKDKNEKSDNI